MAIHGKYFEYNGKSSKDFGIMVGVFNSTSDDIPMGLTRSVNRGEMTKYRYRANHYGATYDDVLEFELGIIKDPCKFNGNDMKFSRSEIRAINAWLTSPQFPKLFHMIDYDSDILRDDYVDYFCTITDVTATGAGDIFTLTYTLTCDSPFGYSEAKTHFIQKSDSVDALFTVLNESDDLENYVYPTLKVIPTADGEVRVENLTDGGVLTIQAIANLTIYIDSSKLMMYDETKKLITFEDLGIDDIDNIYWFRLCHGTNEIRITGDASVEITYRECRKVGAY